MAEHIEREVTCDDCIHYDICIFHITGNENKKCIHFKNKDDVVEVRHGEWKFNKDGSGTCNQCGFTQKNVWDYDRWQNYCGVCGAKMYGKGEW